MSDKNSRDTAARSDPAHGGMLKELIIKGAEHEALDQHVLSLPSVVLGEPQLLDLALLLNGAFSPLDGFLNEGDWESVVRDMRLRNGTLWPMPITLDLPSDTAGGFGPGSEIVLRDNQGFALGVLRVDSIWRPDKEREARLVFGTTDPVHPGVNHLLNKAGDTYVGGKILGLRLPGRHGLGRLSHTPAEVRKIFAQKHWTRVIGFQTRNPLHRAHVELTKRAMESSKGKLLIHPVVGLTKPGDVDRVTRVRCYDKVLKHYPDESVVLSTLPLAMRMGGPREAVWHAIIRRNFGCSHFIVGRDHAGPGSDGAGRPFYGPYDAQELAQECAAEIGIEIIPFQELVYVPSRDAYLPVDEVEDGVETHSISGTELRNRLEKGEEIPPWFSYPEVIAELRRAYPLRRDQGFTLFFTGLSGAGKSTIADALLPVLAEYGRVVTLLDGDDVRALLSSELGFSREHRDLNIKRIAFVAQEVTRHRGVAVCAPIAPYGQVRAYARETIGEVGGYFEIYVSTPLEVCEQRDPKGLYAKARAGLIKGFTGIDDPYEPPDSPEIEIDTSRVSIEQAVEMIIERLRGSGYLP